MGLGNECSLDMAEMVAACPQYDCYTNTSTGEVGYLHCIYTVSTLSSICYIQLNVNGCSYVPNTLFNEAACNIHDLCYITPGASKQDCDDTFVTNIVR